MEATSKEKAIALRRRGLSYSEILKEVSVAKSTLALWLQSVNLSKKQTQRLTEKKLLSARRGGMARHTARIALTQKIYQEARKDIRHLTKRELWLAGVLLYWAEGSKERDSSVGTQLKFNNSDPRMVRLFLIWLKEVFNVQEDDIVYELYIHKTGDAQKAIQFWENATSCERGKIRIYFKRHRVKKTNRKNVEENYHGLLRVGVRKSSSLNRKIDGWVNALCEYWGIV